MLNQSSNNLFGNSTQQSTSKESQPFLGINMRGYYTSMPQLRDGFKSRFPNNYYGRASKLSLKRMLLIICVTDSTGNRT